MEYFGTPSMSMVSKSLGSEIREMHISLENGTQIQVKAMPMRSSTAYVVTMLTYDAPYWMTIAAGETPDVALSAISRMVGATDTVLQGDSK